MLDQVVGDAGIMRLPGREVALLPGSNLEEIDRIRMIRQAVMHTYKIAIPLTDRLIAFVKEQGQERTVPI